MSITVQTVCAILSILSTALVSTVPLTFSEDLYILPTVDGHCPSHPCYSLLEAFDNPTQVFTSNTTVIFPAGTFRISVGKAVIIQDVNNLSLTGGGNSHTHWTKNEQLSKYTDIVCDTDIGLIFMNVTDLLIHKLQFLHCGTSLPPNVLDDFLTVSFSIAFDVPGLKPSLALIHIHSMRISDIAVANNSVGPGILGINIFGSSFVSDVVCRYNEPNTIFLFVTSIITVPLHNSFHILNSEFSSEILNFNFKRWTHAVGLSIVLDQTTYYVHVALHDVKSLTNGQFQNVNSYIIGQPNLFIAFWKCCMCGDIWIDGLDISGAASSHLILQTIDYGRVDYQCKCRSTFQYNNIQLRNILLHPGTGTGWTYTGIELENSCHNRGVTTIKNLTAYSIGLAIKMQNVSVFVQEGFNITDTWGILAYKSNIDFDGVSYFINNSGVSAVVLQDSNVTFSGRTIFIRNRGRRAGAINVLSSTVTFIGELQFIENQGYNGGGLALHGSTMSLKWNAKVVFLRNHAMHYGGALYVSIPGITTELNILLDVTIICFFKIEHANHTSYPNISFIDNTAVSAGSAIYGGSVDTCQTIVSSGGKFKHEPGFQYFKNVFHFYGTLSDFSQISFKSPFQLYGNISDLSQISSNPYRVCLCNSTNIDCNSTGYDITVYPGQTFHIPAVAVGQMLGTVPSTVLSEFLDDNTDSILGDLEQTQQVQSTCTDLQFTVFSINVVESIQLKAVERSDVLHEYAPPLLADTAELILLSSDLLLHVTLLPCPLGFVFHNGSCKNCNPTLRKHNILCDINTQTIQRRSQIWVNATTLNATHHGIIIHEHCPFYYCKLETVHLNLQYPDEQCALRRSGILCGKCQHNFSHVLGSSNCKKCSNIWILLIIPFACAGVALAVFLMLLNLTVSVGSINGLIFYANVVRANQAVFFPNEVTNSFLSWFIAWVNLDLGFEVCFYNGMDAFAKTWLQFVFPIYIWLIVILIIVSSHYYTKAAKLSGRNAVQVLATLFLLSYAKLLQATITIISSTTLEYPDGSIRRVWLYDGNVDYLKGKHIPLFMATLLVLLVLSLPYTALLLFIQCLQQKTKYRALFWIGKFKPLFDAYTGPYQDKHRYWTGLLLLLRAVLFLIFSVNVFGDPAINLLVITLTVFCLFAFLVLFAKGRIYKVRYSNVLECAFLLNLGFLCSGTLYCRLTNGNQAVLTYTSVGIAFAIFTVVVVIHTLTRLRQYQFEKWLTTNTKGIVLKCKVICQRMKKVNLQHNNSNEPQATATDSRQVPITFIELREPLLEYYN